MQENRRKRTEGGVTVWLSLLAGAMALGAAAGFALTALLGTKTDPLSWYGVGIFIEADTIRWGMGAALLIATAFGVCLLYTSDAADE